MITRQLSGPTEGRIQGVAKIMLNYY